MKIRAGSRAQLGNGARCASLMTQTESPEVSDDKKERSRFTKLSFDLHTWILMYVCTPLPNTF